MKNLAGKLAAVLAAAVMTVLAAGISVSADTEADTPKYTGWVSDKNGWQYLEDGVPYKGKPYKIDGVYYEFSEDGYCEGKYWGWLKKERCYWRGVPYTGWEELYTELNEYGYYDPIGSVYCINGYPMKGEVRRDGRRDGEIYRFDKNISSSNEKPYYYELDADCAPKISVDAEEILITVNSENYNSYEHIVGSPEKMERLKNGKWESCGNPSEYAVDDAEYVICGTDDNSPDSATMTFYPKRYMGGNMPAGFYRIIIPYVGGYSNEKKEVYAIFEAVPPIEVSMPEEPYLADDAGNTEMSILVKTYSEKKALQPEALADSLKLELMKKTVSGWESCKINGYSTGYTDNENELKIDVKFTADAEYYKAVLNFGGKDYSITFRTVTPTLTTWLEEYSLKSDDIAVSFTVYNELDDPVKIRTDLIYLYKKENGKWTAVQDKTELYPAEVTPQYTTLNAYYKTALTFDLSDLYDTSKLEAGNYAVFVGGVGYAEFRLTDKEPKSDKLLFESLKAEDIKEIQLIWHSASLKDLKSSFTKGKYFDRSLDHLRQLKFKRAYEQYSPEFDNFSLDVVVRLNGGKKMTLKFYDPDAAIYNGGTVYTCNWQIYYALKELLFEVNGKTNDPLYRS